MFNDRKTDVNQGYRNDLSKEVILQQSKKERD
jgi:hypothetical protein